MSGCCSRVFTKRGRGFCFANSLSSEAANGVVRRAFRLAQRGDADTDICLDEIPRTKAKNQVSRGTDPGEIPVEQKTTFLRKITETLKDVIGFPLYVETNYVDQTVEERVCNSFGADTNWRAFRIYILLRAFARRGGRVTTGVSYYATNRGFEALQRLAERGFGKEALEIAEEQLSSKPLASGKYKVLLDHQLAGVLVHEAFGHQLEADNVIRSQSILEDKLGETVAQSCTTVYDDPTLPDSFASVPYDSEGFSATPRILVDKGSIRGYLHSMETASAIGGHPGNARAQNHQVEPVPRMSNICLAPGSYDYAELLDEAEGGLHLRGVGPISDVNASTGEIQIRVQTAKIIDKHGDSHTVEACTLRGNTLSVLKSIRAVGKERRLNMAGFCVKGGQTIPSDGFCPPILVDDVLVTS